MSDASLGPLDKDVAARLTQLVAANVNTVMAQAMTDPVVRAGIIQALEGRPLGSLSTDERLWLDWCKGFK